MTSPQAAPVSDHPRRVSVVMPLTSGAGAGAGDATVPRCQLPVAPGTATDARIERTTSSADTPRSCASGATSNRCSSTEGTTRFTSSGMT